MKPRTAGSKGLKTVLTHLLVPLLCVSVAFAPVSLAFAQEPMPPVPPVPAPAPAKPVATQQELDQMLAPIALYPDSLLSQILMASTYPLEIVEASRWSKANPNLTGEQAVKAVEQYGWDPSVKSLVAFPQIIAMMDEKLAWTERLGDAFLAQQPQVMDTVQNLRQKAYAAGNLRSTDQVRVDQQGQTIVLQPTNPEVIYVPYYDPRLVYGPWWWPAYPPVYWGPWPGYGVYPGFGVGFAWGVGITVGVGFFFGAFDWPHRHINVVTVNNFYFRNPAVRVWAHDPIHRRGVPYRAVELRRQFGRMSAAPEVRREFRGREPSSFERRSDIGRRPEAPRDMRGTPSPPRETRAPNQQRFEQRAHAFEGVGHGGEVRNYSERGHASGQASGPRSGVQSGPQPGGQPGGQHGGGTSPRGGGGGGNSPLGGGEHR
jgi:hypothetical protein